MTGNTESAYRELLGKYKDAMVLSTAQGVLHWDMETMMPPKAVEQRSEQLALMSRLHHKLSTDPQIQTFLTSIQTSPQIQSMGEVEKRNLYLIGKSYREQAALPEKLVGELAMQEAITVNAWKRAKAKKDFALYKADLKKLFELSKQSAEILMKVKETKTPYEALIDNFEPKMSAEAISRTFDELLGGLKPLIAKIEACQTKPSPQVTTQPVPIESQRVIAQLITQTLGYDTASTMACGRVDETEHPFTSGCYDDVRITTHYHLNNYTSSIFSVLHETGHAIYEHNISPEWKYQPVGAPCSYGIHESQSRFYENIVGRSREFWMGFLPQVKVAAPVLAGVGLDEFVRAVNRVERSKIRIEADEVTYSIHIIIRFELERDLFEGKIGIDELPSVWNQKYAGYLGVEVKDDAEGVMQDTHWASGLYGYFPSYALGNIYDGQIVAAINKALPDWRSQLSRGNLQNINAWLKDNIHSRGDLHNPEELIKRATGTALNAKAFIAYLNEKYGGLYGF
ncbi:MAG: carboxypeptidase M32 [Candidatus Bathyarchaeota archaeon]|nr:carboxypeptidase M32 [Candidatus Bathyarchaeota archaeon]